MTAYPAGTVGAVQAHQWQREEHEHYVEPEWCSRRLFEVERFVGGIWDPCCGFGRIPESAKAFGLENSASDIVDRGYPGCRVGDFLKSEGGAPNIVCNPPFNIIRPFAEHALRMAVRKVAMIFPTRRLNAAHWLRQTPLVQVWMLTPRPSMPPGHVIASGEEAGGGKVDFCWLVWEHGHTGRTEFGWLHRDEAEEK